MTYSFRVRFNRSPRDTISSDANNLSIPVEDSRLTVVLKARKDELSVQASDQLALIGSGYESANEAGVAGKKLQNALTVALARVRVGADFGHRAAKGAFTEHGLKWVEERIGQRALNNVHGLMTFQSKPAPRFVSSSADMTRGVNSDSFMAIFRESIQKAPVLSDGETVAFTLFNASFFQPTSDSRFLMLVMALEALIEPLERSSEARSLVDAFVEQAKAALPPNERDSLIGSLNTLKNESISRAGRRLVKERLDGRQYGGKDAASFFTYCYKLRSNLVHGNLPIPTFEEIGAAAAPLEVFVSDLLTAHIVGFLD